jgi:hypothetical protein
MKRYGRRQIDSGMIMSRYGGRKLDPTALYAAVMTIACLLISTYPAPARSGVRVASSGEATCTAKSSDSVAAVADSITAAMRAALLGPSPADAIAGR